MSDSVELRLQVEDEELKAEELGGIKAFIYIDNDDRHVDDLQIITNNASIFSGKKITASLVDKKRDGRNKTAVLNCGTFFVDDKKESNMIDTHIIKAAATTSAATFRQDEKCQAWERINLKKLAQELTSRNGVQMIYATEFNPVFARKEQRYISDIKMLADTCKSVGLSLKFTNTAAVIYSPYEYAVTAAVRTFTKGDGDIRDDNLHHAENGTAYGKCCLTYFDPVKKEIIKGEYTASDNPRTLQIRTKASSTEEANMIAKFALLEANAQEYTGYIECEGDIALCTGIIIELKGYEEFDRKYIVKKAIHTIKGAIYTTKIFFEMAMGE